MTHAFHFSRCNLFPLEAQCGGSMTLDQIYVQAKAMNPRVTGVRVDQWFDIESGYEDKYWAFTDDETFMGRSAEALLADILASTKGVAA